MVTNRKHKNHYILLIALNMKAISPHLPPMGGQNSLHSAQRKESILDT